MGKANGTVDQLADAVKPYLPKSTEETLRNYGYTLANKVKASEAEHLASLIIKAATGKPLPPPTDTEKPPPTFTLLAELLANPELLAPPAQVIPRLAYRGRLLMLAGPDKSGKSTLMGHAVAAYSQGRHFLGEPVEMGNTLWCGLEEHVGDAVRRFSLQNADGNRVKLVSPEPPHLLAAIREELEKWSADVVVIDSLQEYARCSVSKVPDDGDSAGWATVVRPLAALARQWDLAVVVLHHVRRSDGQYRGSSEIAAAVDCTLELYPARSNDDPAVRHIRGRARWPVQPFDVAFREGCYGLADGAELNLETLCLIHVEKYPGTSLAATTKAVGRRRESIRAALNKLETRGAIIRKGPDARPTYETPGSQVSLEVAS